MAGSIYLDSSAGVKLVAEETESNALQKWLADRPRRASSSLFRVELLRAVKRLAPDRVSVAQHVIDAMTLIGIDDNILTFAAQVGPLTLRTLDAIHIATAMRLGRDLDVLVTYDRRMIEAAQQLGLPVASPA